MPSAIRAKGTFVVATDASYPPLDFYKPGDQNVIIGMEPDLTMALGRVLDLKIRMQNVTFDSIIPGLQDGKYDMGMSGYGVTKQREQVVDFVSYLSAGQSFYVKSDSTASYNGLAALCGVKVAVENGTTEQTATQSQIEACKTAGKPALTMLQFPTQTAVNLAVSNGRADVGFADSPTVAYIVQTSNGQFKEVGPSILSLPYGIALPKDNGMAPAVLAAMKVIIANGQYATILKKWNMSNGAIKVPVINGATS